MDLSTIRKKLESKDYDSVMNVKKDIDLIISNSFLFNQPHSQVYKDTEAFQAYISKEWDHHVHDFGKYLKQWEEQQATAQLSNQSSVLIEEEKGWVSSPEAKKCARILRRLQQHKSAGPFRLPVDPVALGIPNYFEVIKQPMDFSTIEKKLNHGEYDSIDAFYLDVQLVFDNCCTFNPSGILIHKIHF
jgi:hypothetical protein